MNVISQRAEERRVVMKVVKENIMRNDEEEYRDKSVEMRYI